MPSLLISAFMALIVIGMPSHSDNLNEAKEEELKRDIGRSIAEKAAFDHPYSEDWFDRNRDHLLSLSWEDYLQEFGDEEDVSPYRVPPPAERPEQHIGFTFYMSDEGPRVWEIMEDSPSAVSGLELGSLLISIGDEPLSGLSYKEIHRLLSVPALADIDVVYQSPSGDERTANLLIFHNFDWGTSVYRTADDIGVIRIRAQTWRTKHQINNHVARILEEENPPSSWIIDIRGNTGGDVRGTRDVLSMLIEGGKIGSTHDVPNAETFRADKSDILQGAKLYVLMDRNTAGTAEWMAAVLKDRERAVLAGESTAGQVSMRTYFPVDVKYADEVGFDYVMVKSGTLATPSGDIITSEGVSPDIQISTTEPQADLDRLIGIIHRTD